MNPHKLARTTFVLFLVIAAPFGCKRKDDAGSTSSSGGFEHAGGGGGSAEAPKGTASSGCALPEGGEITANVTITKGCKVTVPEWIHIKNRGVLTIEPGARLAFGSDGGIQIDEGRLVAKGTAEAPVTFTSRSSSPGPGDWEGIVFNEAMNAGNELDHVVVEYAGKDHGRCEGAVCIAQDPPGGRLSVTNSVIQSSGNFGFASMSSHPLAKFENNTLKSNKSGSLRMVAQALGSIGANTLADPVHVHGDITQSVKWPKVGVPIIADDPIHIHGEKAAAVLTLADKTTMKFGAESYVTIGGGAGGGLLAKDAVFTSANTPAAEGDWVGLVFDSDVVSTNLEGCTIEYAGREGASGMRAAMAFHVKGPKELKGVKVTKTTLRHNHGAAVWSTDHDCGEIAAPASGNKAEGGPLCAK